MVSIAVLGHLMMGGMGIGIFTNAGLANSEIKEKCKMINELVKEIENVKTQTKVLLDKFHVLQNEEDEIIKQTKESMDNLKTKINEMKKKNKFRLDREEYVHFCMVTTIIIIILVKTVLSIFFKDKIK